MSQGVNIPYVMIAETPALADQVNANFEAVRAKFGNIVDGDVATIADLDGNKMSQTPGKQIPTAALADRAVTDAKLAYDVASPGSDTNRAVSGDHIKTLTTTHISRIVPATSLGKDKLKVTIGTKSPGPLLMPFAALPVAPLVAIPVASNTILGMYFDTVSVSAGSLSTLFAVLANVGGNWQAQVWATGTVSANVTFTLNWAYVANS